MGHTGNHTPDRTNWDTPLLISECIAREGLLGMKHDGCFSSYRSEGYHEIGRGYGKIPMNLRRQLMRENPSLGSSLTMLNETLASEY